MVWRLENITIGYQDPLFTVDTFHIKENFCHALVGENGKGKSSFLRCLAGIDKLFAGELNCPKVLHDNMVLVSTRRPEIDYLSVKDYLTFGISSKPTAFALQLIERLKLDVDFDQEVKSLSDGQFRRLAIVRQLQQDPKLILLDEPSAHLDRENKRILIDLILELKKTKTVVVTSHDFSFLNAVADSVHEIKDKRLVEIPFETLSLEDK